MNPPRHAQPRVWIDSESDGPYVFCPVCDAIVLKQELTEHAIREDDVEHAVYAVHES
jgi:hypothetical protein